MLLVLFGNWAMKNVNTARLTARRLRVTDFIGEVLAREAVKVATAERMC
jgi:hypothetical protein